MESNIAEIHDKVYEFLTTKHPDLCFTMRQKDRAGRFGLGYWFSGNDDYLAFSFWKGLDWRNKTPNIFFAINADGTPTLEFVSHDNEPMTNLFDALSIPLRTVQKTRTKTKELFEHWVKNYETNDYIAVLDNFIRHDKKMIDKLISVTGLSETLAPIDRTVFEKNNRRVTKTRKDAHNKEKYAKEFINTKSIYVKELTIDKITLFKNEQTINFFDETTNTFKNVTCFIGLNGTGKTSILRAVTLAFLGFENDTVGKDDGLITSRLQNMLNIKGIKDKKKDFVKSGYSKITYQVNDVKGNSKDFANKVVLKNENGTVIIEDDSNSVFENIIDDKPKSLFLAFPQIQGEGSETDEDEPFAVEAPNSKDAISMLNNEPDNRLGRFTKWLKTLNEIANAHQANGIAMPDERKVLDTIFRIIGKVTNDSSDIEYKMVITDDGTDIWLKLDALTGYIPLNLISQGYQNVFGWIGYFMKRLRDVTPKGDDFSQTAAIVLIDEIDTYLHPKWQYNILSCLITEFPNVQFIVTTHSPYFVGSIPNDKIKIYVCKKKEEEKAEKVEIKEFTQFNAYGANVDALTEEIFDATNRPKEIDSLFQGLFKHINQGTIDSLITAQAICKDLEHKIDYHDTDLARARILIQSRLQVLNTTKV